jgi:hypothetical protein
MRAAEPQPQRAVSRPSVRGRRPKRVARPWANADGATGAFLLCAWLAGPALAGEPVILAATARPIGETWNFDVTLHHADEGWQHFADRWRLTGPDGTVYGLRELFHPHVDEQPFTRSLSGVVIPSGVTWVSIEAHDIVHGWGGSYRLDLPRAEVLVGQQAVR